jgi:hypothetical protein
MPSTESENGQLLLDIEPDEDEPVWQDENGQLALPFVPLLSPYLDNLAGIAQQINRSAARLADKLMEGIPEFPTDDDYPFEAFKILWETIREYHPPPPTDWGMDPTTEPMFANWIANLEHLTEENT